MSLITRYIPHSAHIKTAASVDAWINGIESITPDQAVSLFEESTGSAYDREFVATREVASALALVTSDLTALSTVGFDGLLIAPDTGKPGLVAYGRELPLGGLPTAIATANHLQLAVSDGILVPVGIRASHNTVAKLSLMLHAILGTAGTSGATPFVWTASSAIASGAGATANVYTLGPSKYTISGGASRLCQGMKDLNVSFGIQVLREGSDGDVYPSHVSIIMRAVKIEFSTADIGLISEIGDGISVSAYASYFRKITSAGQRVAAATTSHVKIAGTAGMVTPGAVGLTHRQPGTAAFTYTPTLNTNQIAITVGAAIPTS